METKESTMETKHQSLYTIDLIGFSYTCSSISNVDRLKYSNKILLPESVLYTLNQRDDLEFPLFFKVINKDTEFGQVCGVEEFSSPPGVCYLPYHIMSDIHIKEGDKLCVQLVRPDKGNYVKFQFHTSEFTKLSNPKVILEKIMSSDYPVITEGQTIVLNYKAIKKQFRMNIVETKPSDIIQIINTNINVDFDKPLIEDYSPPPAPSVDSCCAFSPPSDIGIKNVKSIKSRDISGNLKRYKNIQNGFIPFSGKGNRLGNC